MTYHATIYEPQRALPKPDKYGTLTMPGNVSTFGTTLGPLREWAKMLLPACSPGSYCDIAVVTETFVERIGRDECSEPH